jgi:hypothetical protein
MVRAPFQGFMKDTRQPTTPLRPTRRIISPCSCYSSYGCVLFDERMATLFACGWAYWDSSGIDTGWPAGYPAAYPEEYVMTSAKFLMLEGIRNARETSPVWAGPTL